MGVSRYWMNHSGLIGAFLRNTLIFRKRIQNMRYWRTLIVLSNTKSGFWFLKSSNLFSKIIPSFFVDKASCTRQFESELSLNSLASLFPIKEGSTPHLGLLPSGKKRETALLGARNRFAIRLADHQRSSPCYAGCDRLGKAYWCDHLTTACWLRAPRISEPRCKDTKTVRGNS